MRRKATILDVLRDAQKGDGVQMPVVAPIPALKADRPDDPKPAESPLRARWASTQRWLREPIRLRRLGAGVAMFLALALIWVAFELGMQKGRNGARAAERPREPELSRSSPVPMSESVGQAGPASAERQAVAPPTAEVKVVEGLRITTNPNTEANRTRARAMCAHMNEALRGVDAEARYFFNADQTLIVVGVVFGPSIAGQAAAERALFERLKTLPAPDPREVTFDFKGLEESRFRNRVR